MSQNVPNTYRHLETMPLAEIEIRIQRLRGINEASLTEDQLTEAVALHAIARRKTAGPPKTRKADTAVMANADLGDLTGLIFGSKPS